LGADSKFDIHLFIEFWITVKGFFGYKQFYGNVLAFLSK